MNNIMALSLFVRVWRAHGKRMHVAQAHVYATRVCVAHVCVARVRSRMCARHVIKGLL